MMKTSFPNLQFDATILARLRKMAKQGEHASELAAFLFEQICRPNLIMAIAYFMAAFCIGLNDARVLEVWGTWTNEQINDELDPIIALHAPEWREES